MMSDDFEIETPINKKNGGGNYGKAKTLTSFGKTNEDDDDIYNYEVQDVSSKKSSSKSAPSHLRKSYSPPRYEKSDHNNSLLATKLSASTNQLYSTNNAMDKAASMLAKYSGGGGSKHVTSSSAGNSKQLTRETSNSFKKLPERFDDFELSEGDESSQDDDDYDDEDDEMEMSLSQGSIGSKRQAAAVSNKANGASGGISRSSYTSSSQPIKGTTTTVNTTVTATVPKNVSSYTPSSPSEFLGNIRGIDELDQSISVEEIDYSMNASKVVEEVDEYSNEDDDDDDYDDDINERYGIISTESNVRIYEQDAEVELDEPEAPKIVSFAEFDDVAVSWGGDRATTETSPPLNYSLKEPDVTYKSKPSYEANSSNYNVNNNGNYDHSSIRTQPSLQQQPYVTEPQSMSQPNQISQQQPQQQQQQPQQAQQQQYYSHQQPYGYPPFQQPPHMYSSYPSPQYPMMGFPMQQSSGHYPDLFSTAGSMHSSYMNFHPLMAANINSSYNSVSNNDPVILDLLRELKQAKEDASWAKSRLADMISMVNNGSNNENHNSNSSNKYKLRKQKIEEDIYEEEYSNDFEGSILNTSGDTVGTQRSRRDSPDKYRRHTPQQPSHHQQQQQPLQQTMQQQPAYTSAIHMEMGNSLCASQALFRRHLSALRDKLNVTSYQSAEQQFQPLGAASDKGAATAVSSSSYTPSLQQLKQQFEAKRLENNQRLAKLLKEQDPTLTELQLKAIMSGIA